MSTTDDAPTARSRGTIPRVWDAVVVGAGPAGAIAARTLALAGADVLLVDRSMFPRSKVCGGCVNARACRALAASGLWDAVSALSPHVFAELHLAAGGATARVPVAGGVAISRARFDELLVEAAADAGARFQPGTRAWTNARPDAKGDTRVLTLGRRHGPTREIAGRVVVIADGLAGPLGERLIGPAIMVDSARIGVATTLEADATVPWRDDAVNMAVSRGGYVGAVRIEDRRWNVAAAVAPVDVRSARSPAHAVARIVNEAGWSPPMLERALWQGTPGLWRRPRATASWRVYAVGDATGYVEPFTGDGIACALETGRAVTPFVLRAVDAWEPQLQVDWDRTVAACVGRSRWLAAAMARVARHERLAAHLVGWLARAPALAAPFSGRFGHARSEGARS